MHQDSASIFSALSHQGFHIDVVGGDDEKWMERAVEVQGGKVAVHGWVEDALEFYERSDIFIYPLRPGHYGSGEQVILEAMAAGLPVIIFDNPAESAIISHGETGYIAKTSDEFIAYVIKIAQDRELYAKMSERGIARVRVNFDSVAMANVLLDKIRAQFCRPKVKIHRQVQKGSVDIGLELFRIHSFFEQSLESGVSPVSEGHARTSFRRIVRDLDSPEKRGAWTSKTKGSPFHYLQFFPESEGLRLLCSLITEHLNSDAGKDKSP
jgi:hypothetical protein